MSCLYVTVLPVLTLQYGVTLTITLFALIAGSALSFISLGVSLKYQHFHTETTRDVVCCVSYNC